METGNTKGGYLIFNLGGCGDKHAKGRPLLKKTFTEEAQSVLLSDLHDALATSCLYWFVSYKRSTKKREKPFVLFWFFLGGGGDKNVLVLCYIVTLI